MTAFRCVCYGLRIEADVPLPGLLPTGDCPGVDVRLHTGRLPEGFAARRSTARRWRAGASLTEDRVPVLVVSRLPDDGDFLFEYVDGTEFVVSADGSAIWTRWAETSSLEDMATYLLGPVLGFVLRLRGTVCLHASVVVLPVGAVGFVGPAGGGKSTLAAAFAQLGRPVVTDDVAALVEAPEGVLVQPGYPRLRLWPESVRALFGAPDALPPLTPTWDKRCLDLDPAHVVRSGTPPRLAALYVLERRTAGATAPVFAEVASRDRLMALVANGYVTNLLDERARAREFEVLGRLAGAIPLRRVALPDDTGALEDACRALAADAQALAAR